MDAPCDIFRDGAVYGPLARKGEYLVYPKGAPILDEHADEVAALTKKPGPTDVVG